MYSNDSIVWKETDGFANKYGCALSVYFMKIISSTLKISIYRSIFLPVNVKYVVESI